MSSYFETIARRIQGTLFVIIAAAIIGIFILMVISGLYLRVSWRTQILERDGVMLDALVDLNLDENTELSLDEVLYELAIEASSLRGVLSFEVFDSEGEVLTVLPIAAIKQPLLATDFEMIRRNPLLSRFHPEVPLDLLYADAELTKEAVVIPVEEILIGVEGDEATQIRVVRFWLDGSSIAEQYEALDRNLIIQGLNIWTVVSLFIVFLGVVARIRLKKLTTDLEARSMELEAANRNLEMAARSAAVGAISGNLMHGLKNPLAGLRAYLKSQGDEAAGEAAQRMQRLVSDTLMMLKGEGREGSLMSLGEIKGFVTGRVEGVLNGSSVALEWKIDEAIELNTRVSNVVVLVLENLIHNGIEVWNNQWIQIESVTEEGSLSLLVSDGGTGIDAKVGDELFNPGVTNKANGTGLGLAISRQLARGVGGDLILTKSSSSGCCFELKLRLEVQ
mgnify:CR=1 FL=1